MNVKKPILYFFVLVIFSTFVLASPLDVILNPFSTLNIAQLYLNYYSFIDAVIYLMLFMGLAQFVFKRLYKEHSKPIIIGVGLSLTFAMTVFELKTGFYIGKLFILPAVIFLLLLSVLLFQLVKSLFEDTGTAFCLTYMVMYGILISAFSDVWKWINQNVPVLAAIISLALAISLVYLIIKLFGLFKGGPPAPNNQTTPTTPGGTQPPPPGTTPPQPPGTTGGFGNMCEELRTALIAYNDEFRIYVNAFSVVVTRHHECLNNIGNAREADAEDWEQIINARNMMISRFQQSHTIVQQIVTHEHYNAIGADDIRNFYVLLQQYTLISANIVRFEVDITERFNEGNVAPPPGPRP